MAHRTDKPYYQVFPVPDPAVGANLILPQPGKFTSRTLAATFTFATSAVAGNRGVRIAVSDGTTVWYRAGASFVQAANTTVQYALISTGSDYGALDTVVHIPLPAEGLIILPGWLAYTDIVNLDPGDQISDVGALIYSHDTGPVVERSPAYPYDTWLKD